MNTINKIKKTVLITVLCAGTGAWVNAQYGMPSGTSSSGEKGSNGGSSESNQVQKINRASELIGTTVKNEQGERLGKIRDLVVDFSSDKVGYAVLASDSGMLSAEKLHAVPLRAFHPSEDGKYVILNTDKDKLSRAEGFDKNSWPNPENPSWGAQPFWQDNASGSPSSDIGTSPSSSEGSKSKSHRSTDKNYQNNDTMNKSQPRQSPPYGTQPNQTQTQP
jgi:sporulation protein YlmC with PRC-barrel domain